ncbi:hypothetical protein K438DRAFT_1944165 [Mycena galopus ATCC 62051]|nr:hypothetical protein K438DRAFT_1944165 [Mycena galopus ATCC 62051]
MSSRATTPSNDDDMRAIMAAMDQESPTAPATNASERTHSALDSTDDSDDERASAGAGASIALVRSNQNIMMATKLYGDKKRLRGDRITELEVFVYDPPSLREAKMFANLFVIRLAFSRIQGSNFVSSWDAQIGLKLGCVKHPIGNELGKLVKAQAGYHPSHELIRSSPVQKADLSASFPFFPHHLIDHTLLSYRTFQYGFLSSFNLDATVLNSSAASPPIVKSILRMPLLDHFKLAGSVFKPARVKSGSLKTYPNRKIKTSYLCVTILKAPSFFAVYQLSSVHQLLGAVTHRLFSSSPYGDEAHCPMSTLNGRHYFPGRQSVARVRASHVSRCPSYIGGADLMFSCFAQFVPIVMIPSNLVQCAQHFLIRPGK